MSAAPQIDVRDLNSVRRAAKAMAEPGDTSSKVDVIIGDDWTASETDGAQRPRRGGLVTLNRSPLARKIITFNLTALIVLVAGMLYLTPSRDNLAFQRAGSLVAEAELIADIIESRLPQGAPVSLATGDGFDIDTALDGIDLRGGIVVALYDPSGRLIAQTTAADAPEIPGLSEFDSGGTLITDALNALWDTVARTLDAGTTLPETTDAAPGQDLVLRALDAGTLIEGMNAATGAGQFIVASPSSTMAARSAPSRSSPPPANWTSWFASNANACSRCSSWAPSSPSGSASCSPRPSPIPSPTLPPPPNSAATATPAAWPRAASGSPT